MFFKVGSELLILSSAFLWRLGTVSSAFILMNTAVIVWTSEKIYSRVNYPEVEIYIGLMYVENSLSEGYLGVDALVGDHLLFAPAPSLSATRASINLLS